jgi:outer membrane protein
MAVVMLAGALMLGMTTAAIAQSVKVGYVSLARIESESASSTRALEVLRNEFEPRNLQLQKFQKRIEAARQQLENEKGRLPAAEAQAKAREISEMMRQSDQVLQRITDDYELRRKELGARLVEDARVAIKAVAEAGKFDLILQEAIFARPGIDITVEVLKEMEKRAGAAR